MFQSCDGKRLRDPLILPASALFTRISNSDSDPVYAATESDLRALFDHMNHQKKEAMIFNKQTS